jgi:hypothetical protein
VQVGRQRVSVHRAGLCPASTFASLKIQ